MMNQIISEVTIPFLGVPMMNEWDPRKLKLGFVGLGKYGYAILLAILRAGHHNLANVFIQSEDKSCPSVVKSNYQDLNKKYNLFRHQDDNDNSPQYQDITGLLQSVAGESDSVGVLIISLNQETGKRVLEEITKNEGEIKGTLWLLLSISNMRIEEVKEKVGNNNIRIVRYLPNMGASEGVGIIAAYTENNLETEARRVVSRVFQGLGEVWLLKNEEDIDAARVIFGSSIGLIAWFAKTLSEAIHQCGTAELGKEPDKASEIVYHSLLGVLALARRTESWEKIIEQIAVSSADGKLGTTNFIISNLEESLQQLGYGFSKLIAMIYDKCLEEHRKGKLEK